MLPVPAQNINLSTVPPANPTLGKPTLVLLVVATVPNKPVVLLKVDMPVICPAICKLETEKVFLVLFHVELIEFISILYYRDIFLEIIL